MTARSFLDYRRFIQGHYDGPAGALTAVTGMLTGHEALAGRLIRPGGFDVRGCRHILDAPELSQIDAVALPAEALGGQQEVEDDGDEQHDVPHRRPAVLVAVVVEPVMMVPMADDRQRGRGCCLRGDPVTMARRSRGGDAVLVVVPREVVAWRHYTAAAIAWALALFGERRPVAEVRRRTSTTAKSAGFGEPRRWATLRRWVAAAVQGDLFGCQ